MCNYTLSVFIHPPQKKKKIDLGQSQPWRKQIRKMANMQYLVQKRQKLNVGIIHQQSSRYS
jgi:hypothetical protein